MAKTFRRRSNNTYSRKNRKEKCRCERRSQIPVDSKSQMDLIWIVWDIFLKEANKRGKLIVKIVNA